MPSSRHHPVPPAARPYRRARVAGLRHPGRPSGVDSPLPPIDDGVEPDFVESRVSEQPTVEPAVEPTVVPANVEWTGPADEEPPVQQADGEPAARRPTAPLVAVLTLALAAVVFGGLAAWFGVQARAAGAVNDNSALTDNASTSQLIGQVNNAINTSFSYRYSDAAATQKAAHNVLVGRALCQYDNLFKLVLQDAPAQKLVLTTQVISSGVESQEGSLARVVIFADQQDTRTDTGQTSYAGAQFAVTAQRIDGQWKISEIDTFTSQAAANAGC